MYRRPDQIDNVNKEFVIKGKCHFTRRRRVLWQSQSTVVFTWLESQSVYGLDLNRKKYFCPTNR